MGEVAGHRHKIRANGQAYKGARITVRDGVGEYDVTNGEGGGFRDQIDTVAGVEITVTNASYDPEENSFAAPLNIRKRSIIDLKIYLDGLDSAPFHVPNFLVLETTAEVDANQGIPITFRGKSKGTYFDPSEAT